MGAWVLIIESWYKPSGANERAYLYHTRVSVCAEHGPAASASARMLRNFTPPHQSRQARASFATKRTPESFPRAARKLGLTTSLKNRRKRARPPDLHAIRLDVADRAHKSRLAATMRRASGSDCNLSAVLKGLSRRVGVRFPAGILANRATGACGVQCVNCCGQRSLTSLLFGDPRCGIKFGDKTTHG
jgi:hypothetical protein